MANHHFISYSAVDAQDFAIRLCDELQAGSPAIRVWLDNRHMTAGKDWDEQIIEAIRICDSFILVVSPDSVTTMSVCRNEQARAMGYKKPIVPVLWYKDVRLPSQLENRKCVDFTGDFDTALTTLRKHLAWLKTNEGKLQVLKDRLVDAQRELNRTDDVNKQMRIQNDIGLLEREIACQKQVVDDPDGVVKRVQDRIDIGLECERQPKKTVSGVTKAKFINPPYGIVPTYFKSRIIKTKLIGDFLKKDSGRLLAIGGRPGAGKTAMVCRILKSIENGRLPDDGDELSVDGIVYLSESGSRGISFVNLFFDLCRLLPEESSRKLAEVYKDAMITTAEKMHSLLKELPQGRVVLVLDNFECKIDPQTKNISDTELFESLKAVLKFEQHSLKVILITRVAPKDLTVVKPSRQYSIRLDEGLELPHVEAIFQEMDRDGKVGLKDTTKSLLSEVCMCTNGFPKALEALFILLSYDRYISLREIMADTKRLQPEQVVERMGMEAFGRLDGASQMVMQALAIYSRPMTSVAIDYLLQPYLLGIDSAPVLDRLVDIRFVLKEDERYYLHTVDRECALSSIPEGKPSDKYLIGEVFSKYALLHLGAEYCRLVKLPQNEWKTIDDLTPQLTEFELRYAGEDYDLAADVLLEIDYYYLLKWGHYHLVIQLHEQLKGKINDSDLQEGSIGNLGTTYSGISQFQQAIACYKQALEISCKIGDRQNECNWLRNLGSCYNDLGKTQSAIKHYEQALKITREIGDRQAECICLGNLGIYYSTLGETKYAIKHYEHGLGIANEIGDRHCECIYYGYLGIYYNYLGETQRAIEYYEQSLDIARKIDYKVMEATNLTNMGEFFIDQNKFAKAIECLNHAVRVADEINSIQFRNEARYALSLVFFFKDDLLNAYNILKEAEEYDYPPNNYNIFTLEGLLNLRKGNLQDARKAFSIATTRAKLLIDSSEHNYNALDSRALSCCGMAICKEDRGYFREEAKQTYKKARTINRDKGYMNRVLRLFDKLAEMDDKGVLKEVRSAVLEE